MQLKSAYIWMKNAFVSTYPRRIFTEHAAKMKKDLSSQGQNDRPSDTKFCLLYQFKESSAYAEGKISFSFYY